MKNIKVVVIKLVGNCRNCFITIQSHFSGSILSALVAGHVEVTSRKIRFFRILQRCWLIQICLLRPLWTVMAPLSPSSRALDPSTWVRAQALKTDLCLWLHWLPRETSNCNNSRFLACCCQLGPARAALIHRHHNNCCVPGSIYFTAIRYRDEPGKLYIFLSNCTGNGSVCKVLGCFGLTL